MFNALRRHQPWWVCRVLYCVMFSSLVAWSNWIWYVHYTVRSGMYGRLFCMSFLLPWQLQDKVMMRDLLFKACVAMMVLTILAYPILRNDYGIQLGYLIGLCWVFIVILHFSRKYPRIHPKNGTTFDTDSSPKE
jgi:hypothetical protein